MGCEESRQSTSQVQLLQIETCTTGSNSGNTIDIPSLKKELHSIREPIEFAAHLAVPQQEIHRIESENHRNAGGLRNAIFTYISENMRIKWSDIWDALEAIGENVLARNIRERKCGAHSLLNGHTTLERKTPLLLAICSDEGDTTGMVLLLLKYYANVNEPDEKGTSPLMHAYSNQQTEIVKMLLDYKADVNHSNLDGTTSLMLASFSEDTTILELLLAKGAAVNAQDKNKATALMYACKNGRKCSVQVLLEHGADANLRDSKGETANNLAIAEGHGSELEELLTQVY